jgi:7-cyano-7-deazaguanine reductase
VTRWVFTADLRARSEDRGFAQEIAAILARNSNQCQTSRTSADRRFPAQMLEFRDMSSSTIATFPNPCPGRDYEIAISCPEFTSVCPMTGLPDFGEIRITYVPEAACIELKSLKFYLIAFRNRGIFYEHATNQILDDLVAAVQPRRMRVVGDFSVRGGIKTTVTAVYPEA